MRSLKPRHATDDAIPTSPMADIAFLLVIFFMLTITFASTRGLDFAVPPETPKDGVKTEAILVRVLVDGGLEVDGKPVAVADLLDVIGPRLQYAPGMPVIVAPRPDTPYGHFIAVYDTLRMARQRLQLDRDVWIVMPESDVGLSL